MLKNLATWVERTLEAISVGLIASMTFVIVYGVVMRKLGASLIWYDEVASVLLVWITYYGAATATIKRAQLGFSGLLYSLKGSLRLAAFWLSELIVLGFFALVAWYGAVVLEFFAGETMISLPWVPTLLTHSVIPLGAALIVLAELLSLPRALADLAAGRSADQAELEEYAEEAGLSDQLFGSKHQAFQPAGAKS
ncbi:TRAP-type C4-dicarboxylate transport system, small permease component [Marinobacterium lacunae]|uniref:TRAP transporter small permease protein n=1 Tax=Marinobacterium lacunae TaxID=1232683 RepID=A0A081FZL2_9GAMM|nr:TRAP transporter small permease subunit [Marinobacterium lacunae]KEA63967.1 TRAP-type C4-dicarboxylate transport system, small permease component [Marinobacterium lacunae]